MCALPLGVFFGGGKSMSCDKTPPIDVGHVDSRYFDQRRSLARNGRRTNQVLYGFENGTSFQCFKDVANTVGLCENPFDTSLGIGWKNRLFLEECVNLVFGYLHIWNPFEEENGELFGMPSARFTNGFCVTVRGMNTVSYFAQRYAIRSDKEELISHAYTLHNTVDISRVRHTSLVPTNPPSVFFKTNPCSFRKETCVSPNHTDTMPRNTTGGSAHRGQRNSEGSKARHNREFIDDLLDDYKNKQNTDGVYVGRVLRRMGSGRMEVLYMVKKKADALEKEREEAVQQIMPMRGGLRGKAKKTVWVDIDSLVMIAETGLAGTTHEIIAVFSPDQVAKYRALFPNADERLFMKNGLTEDEGAKGGGIVFEEEEEDGELDVDNI